MKFYSPPKIFPEKYSIKQEYLKCVAVNIYLIDKNLNNFK